MAFFLRRAGRRFQASSACPAVARAPMDEELLSPRTGCFGHGIAAFPLHAGREAVQLWVGSGVERFELCKMNLMLA